MATGREEAAPTFSTWKGRLEKVGTSEGQAVVAQFLEVLRAIGTPMVSDLEVNFVYCDPRANRVFLAGEFNQWGSRGGPIELRAIGETGVHYHTLKLNSPGRLEYKFIVDGRWQTDPFCALTVDNGIGGENSAFIVGEFKDPPELQPVQGIAHGRVEQFEFRSKRLSNTRQIHVYLPPGYADSEVRFSSLYVHDGGEYLDRARLATVMDNLISKSEIPPLIVVMIDPVNRMIEYRANQGYADFLTNEFVPAIDARYRTIVDRDSRAVMGASLGGLISIYTALCYPAVFSRIAGQSSALQLAEETIASLLARVKRKSLRWYLDVGKYEPSFIPAHDRFVRLLKKRRWPCSYQQLPAGHNWTSWRAHLRDLLVFLWADNSAVRPAPAGKVQ